MGTAQQIIKKFMSTLDSTPYMGRVAMNSATQNSTSYASWQNVINSMITDMRNYRDNSEGFLVDKCGIVLYNEDTGAITGYDAGNGIVKTADTIVPESGASVSPTASSTTIRGLTVNWPTGSNLTQSQKNMIAGLNTWWIPNSLDLINESYGLSFETGNPSVNVMDVNFVEDDESDALAYTSYNVERVNGAYKATSLSLNINMSYYSDISADDYNGSSEDTTFYLDRTIAHEMTHAVMAATVNNFSFLPSLYFVEGVAELTHGIDDQRTSAIEFLSYNPFFMEQVLEENSDQGVYSYAGGYMLMRYFAKQAAMKIPEGASLRGNTLTLNNAFYTSVWLDGENIFSGEEVYKNDYIVNVNAANTTNDTALAGNNQNNKITAGSGDTNLWGGWAGNDTLVGGSGDDVFWYTLGGSNDVIENVSSKDSINLFGVGLSDISGINITNSDMYFTFNDGGSLNVLGGATAQNTFTLGADGTSWRFDNNSGGWNMA